MTGDLTKVALVATLIAILLSLPLLSFNNVVSRAAGLVGLLCGGIPILVLVLSRIVLQPLNLAAVILCQVIWSLIAASLMISGVVLKLNQQSCWE